MAVLAIDQLKQLVANDGGLYNASNNTYINNSGIAVFADLVKDPSQNKFQSEINKELYNMRLEGGFALVGTINSVGTITVTNSMIKTIDFTGKIANVTSIINGNKLSYVKPANNSESTLGPSGTILVSEFVGSDYLVKITDPNIALNVIKEELNLNILAITDSTANKTYVYEVKVDGSTVIFTYLMGSITTTSSPVWFKGYAFIANSTVKNVGSFTLDSGDIVVLTHSILGIGSLTSAFKSSTTIIQNNLVGALTTSGTFAVPTASQVTIPVGSNTTSTSVTPYTLSGVTVDTKAKTITVAAGPSVSSIPNDDIDTLLGLIYNA